VNKTLSFSLIFLLLISTGTQLAAENRLPVSECIDGVAAGYPCSNITLLSHLAANDLQLIQASDNWGWKDEETGRYYALTAGLRGVAFVDVTDPVNPVFLGLLGHNSTLNSITRDVKVYADHAFVVADNSPNHGMQVFDLKRLRGITDPQSFNADVVYNRFEDAHNIAINEESGFAYIVSSNTCGHGLHIVDIRTPKVPVQAGCFADVGDIHDTQCVNYRGPDTDYQGAEICFAANHPNLSMINVSDKSEPQLISQLTYPKVGFPHQGWLTEDQRYFVLGDEADESFSEGINTSTHVFDVADLDQPVYIGKHIAATRSIDHNLYVKGNLLYQANYDSGLRILSLDNLANAEMTELAYFDSQPGLPTELRPRTLGAWNVFPFFDNSTILLSDGNQGLFVLRAELGNPFKINAGLNDAWFFKDTAGQGFFIIVYPDLKLMFLSWFTFETTLPDASILANLGWAGHRWFTAVGPYTGDTATLDIEFSSGGVFDSAEPGVEQIPGGGTITVTFSDCENATVAYDIPSIARTDVVPITRIAPDNVALCKALSGQ
jgi:choice-of-anchor B domain-containing protein